MRHTKMEKNYATQSGATMQNMQNKIRVCNNRFYLNFEVNKKKRRGMQIFEVKDTVSNPLEDDP